MFIGSVLTAQVLAGAGLVAGYDVKSQWAWVDKSCDNRIGRLNAAGKDYDDLVKAALGSVGPEANLPSNKLQDLTLTAYMGVHDPHALVHEIQWKKLDFSNGRKIPYSLYCDATAFEWVTEYREGPQKGETLDKKNFPKGGAWYPKDGRRNPDITPEYISGEPKSDMREDFCHTAKGAEAAGVSAKLGQSVVLCPSAFGDKVREKIDTSATDGKLDDQYSTGAVLLHEMTHVVLGKKDTAYLPLRCIALASINGYEAQNNADSWVFYAMATLLNKSSWVLGFGKPIEKGTEDSETKNASPKRPDPRDEPVTAMASSTISLKDGAKYTDRDTGTIARRDFIDYILGNGTADPIISDFNGTVIDRSSIIDRNSVIRHGSIIDQHSIVDWNGIIDWEDIVRQDGFNNILEREHIFNWRKSAYWNGMDWKNIVS
ncbi:hypothetical protein JX265_000400 [Neoarthrinium moseri]|uniref:Lysine-specific metallo-endopeptidase domain-containing protein n=1 Tax=Neoarthrinium moseri TaxID=1658444 RepID=A0A9P9WYC9_9PEZI|nr:hypothetical protein JX265_000400 [Neoarthrinium moseri]